MWFKLFYLAFFLSQLFYGEVYVGIFTPRQIMTLAMFFYCVVSKNLRFDKYVILYFIFISFFGLSSWISGFALQFVRVVLGFYFVAYVGYCATRALVEEYDGENWLLYCIVIIGLVNSIVVIGQYYGFSFATQIKSFLGIEQSEFYASVIEDEIEGVALPGLFTHAVVNGYFCCLSTIAVLFLSKEIKGVFVIFLWSINFLALYCVQQRMALGVALVFSAYVMFRELRTARGYYRNVAIFFFILALIGGLIGLGSVIQSSATRYALGLDPTGRTGLFRSAWQYIYLHPILGGFFDFSRTGMKAHNIFLNCFLYGGLFGGIAVLVLLFQQLKACFFALNNKVSSSAPASFIYVVTGDVNTWIMWGALISLLSSKKYVYQKNCSV